MVWPASVTEITVIASFIFGCLAECNRAREDGGDGDEDDRMLW